jgi:hypothetical protein
MKLREITESTPVGYDKNGNAIEAERLSRWAYNQLATAPELLEAAKMLKRFNDQQHAGISISAEQWSEAYQLTQKVLTKVEG